MAATKYEFPDNLAQPQFKQNTNRIEKIICKICQTYFPTWISLEHHLENCYRRVCGVCGQTYGSDEALYEHTLTHQAPLPYRKGTLKQRKQLETYKCIFCKMSYKYPAEIRYHMITHITVKHYLCSYCGNKFSLSHHSKCPRTHSQHSHTHINKKTVNKVCAVRNTRYKPHECSEVCSEVLNFGLRQQALTNTYLKPYECPVCSKSFAAPSALTIHKRIHTGEKPYECSYCCKRFNQLSNLRKHTLIHSAEKPYECSRCSKRFNQLGNLKQHELIHIDDTTELYECSYCSKHFTTLFHLTQHKSSHTGENRFECSHCNKRFAHLSKLKVHERTHTGEKPYECSYCSKSFSQLGNLKMHILTHTGEKPYQCSHCSKPFTYQRTLKKHTCNKGSESSKKSKN